MFIQRLLLFQYVYRKTNQLTGNVYSDSQETIKVIDIRSRYEKYIFLIGKVNRVIVSLLSFWAFSTDRNDAFLHFHILQLVKSLPVYILEALKRYPFRSEPSLPPGSKTPYVTSGMDSLITRKHVYRRPFHDSLKKLNEFIFIQSVRSV